MADFGSDISTFPDLDPAFATMTGPRVVAEAIARRLTTPRGSLIYAPDYGQDVRGYLNDAVGPGTLAKWEREIQHEAEQDERVQSADVSLSYDSIAMSLTITVQATTADGPFSLVLLATALNLSILDAR